MSSRFSIVSRVALALTLSAGCSRSAPAPEPAPAAPASAPRTDRFTVVVPAGIDASAVATLLQHRFVGIDATIAAVAGGVEITLADGVALEPAVARELATKPADVEVRLVVSSHPVMRALAQAFTDRG